MEARKEFHYFTIFNHEKEEAFLRQRHKEGWKFTKVTGIGMYHFEKCDPEDYVYQLDFRNGTEADKDEYLQLFSDCGWEYVFVFAGYSYFRKKASEMTEDEEIFNDNTSKMEMMDRVYKGRLTPLLILFCATLLPQFIVNLSAGNKVAAATSGSALFLYIIVFAVFGINYIKTKNKFK